ncbi:MAG TPA: DUF3156 family protein [Anaerolineae bacterium]|jgi:hypothetical protein
MSLFRLRTFRAFGEKPRPPRSYRPGRLLELVAREFDGFESRRLADNQIELSPIAGSGPGFTVRERVLKHFLAHTVTAEFECRLGDAPPGEGKLQLIHTGVLTRTGIRVQVKRSSETAPAIATKLTADESFVQAILPLDFQYFYLVQDEQGWHAVTGQIGAAWVHMALPPTRRYVRMGPEQVEALIATFKRLEILLT